MKYLSVAQVLAIHFDQIERYGGSHGVRDLSLLESAVSRPQSSFGGEDLYTDIFFKAAALMHSLALNHPFFDGNKRTSIVSAARFLYINGYSLEFTQEQFVEFALKVATKKLDIVQISAFLKKHSKKA